MDKEIKGDAHPSFVNIIKQLTSDEAKLINLFATPNQIFPLLTLRWEFKTPTPDKQGGKDVLSNFSLFANNAGLECLKKLSFYFKNLDRLGVIEIPEFFHYTRQDAYETLENAPEIKNLRENIENNPDLICVTQKKGIKITDLGKEFIKVCVRLN